ncbi:uncharacterized protein PAC_16968 [Phialocephala subalpina]|uniref:Uncharacterized protein n=1 Tax=Phialocephala subalpina TaxID=576137 RepID=A0A1L7XPW3_9HELO|nr:uncharacterized protein PAC_16968 [Phialocephala subalpina]
MLLSIGLVVLASFIEKAASDILSACVSVSTSSSSTSTSAGGLPTSCPPIKTCAWGYGDMHTIYEDYPNFSKEQDYTKRTFEVSQIVDDEVEHDADGNQIPITNGKAKKGPRSRIFTVANLGGWGGFGDRTCSLNFRIPCNSTTPFHHTGSAIVAARTLIWPHQRPTWNNVVHSFPSLVGCEVLGTFGPSYEPGAWEEIHPDVCRNVTNELFNFAVVYSIDESVKESASLTFDFPPLYEATAAGPYMNWSCPYW